MKSSSPLELATARLRLIAQTIELARAASSNPVRFSELLSANVPDEWPPEVSADAQEYWIPHLEKDPSLMGWTTWYVVELQEKVLIGEAGFKGKPTVDGAVEIGYAILEQHHRRGYASEAVSELIRWAFTHPAVRRVEAQTYPHLVASIGVMRKNGLRYLDTNEGEGTVRYVLAREQGHP